MELLFRNYHWGVNLRDVKTCFLYVQTLFKRCRGARGILMHETALQVKKILPRSLNQARKH